MSSFEFIANTRTEVRKGAMRRMRRAGRVPAVLYGAGKDVALLEIDANHVRKQLANEAFFSHILEVKVDGESTQAVLKALQRDPSSHSVIHIDLLRVSSTTELTMNVPLHFVDEERCPGVKQGGIANHHMTEIEIACLPKDLPEYISIFMAQMQIGDTVHMSDIALPEGVRLTADISDAAADQPVVSIAHPAVLEEPSAEVEEGVEEEVDEAAVDSASETSSED